MRTAYDVAIAGGGPAGAAAAISLARSGHSVLMASAPSPRRFPIGEIVPPDICVELSRIGCREAFLRDGHLRTRGMRSFWGSDAPQFRDSFATPLGCGWYLDRSRFESTLLAEAESSGVEVLRSTRMLSAVRQQGCWLVKLRSAETEGCRRARFLIDATGRAALLARSLGARRAGFDRLTAVYAVLAASDNGAMSAIESCRVGWWYSAPIASGQTVVALFSDSDLVHSKCLASAEVWFELLRETAIMDMLACRQKRELKLAVCSAATQLVECGGVGWVCAGDAAAAWDPLASAGITMALRTGLEASTAIQACFAGDGQALARYADRIYARTREFLARKAAQYEAERRWIEDPFWQRRIPTVDK